MNYYQKIQEALSGASKAYMRARRKNKFYRQKLIALADYPEANKDEGVYVDIHKNILKKMKPFGIRMRRVLYAIPTKSKRNKERGYGDFPK